MLEVGVGMVACCLPTLRLLFQGLSTESVLLNVRKALSLGSDTSRGSSKEYRTAESETSVTASYGQAPVYSGQHHHGHMESHAVGLIPAYHAQSDTTFSKGEIHMEKTVEIV